MNGLTPVTPSLETIQALMETGSFEEVLAALEVVVEHLERGRLPLAETVAWYETGLALNQRCGDLLAQAELRISELESSYGLMAELAESEVDNGA
jgi:exodeoxyribonuclease VII small subunit